MPGLSEVLALPPSTGVPAATQQQEHQQDENKNDKENQTPNQNQNQNQTQTTSVATHTKTIGIIHPPPDIRNIVDKTAQFVARNGPEFEKRILANEKNNVKFNFLNPADPYHAYYQYKVSEHKSQSQAPAPAADSQQKQTPTPASQTADSGTASVESGSLPRPPGVEIPAKTLPLKPLQPPEAEQYTVRLPEGITGEELDIIKLTAQFVARNGKSFLTGLTSREINNPQFHFLKPTHSMFTFFTSLTDSYSKVLMPPKGLIDKLRKDSADMTTVLERCLHRLEWEKSQEQARQKAEDELEKERMEMAMIDWHDFVVVETIEFADDEDEELPQPMTLEEVIRRSKALGLEDEEEVAADPAREVEMEMDEEEVGLVEESLKASGVSENKKTEEQTVPSDDSEPPLRIVKNWKRPEERLPAERDPTKFVVSPITGELIPISEMAEHMRISLIDPKYKEQKERMMAKLRETTLAPDDEISRNIVGLARTRPDIFGTTEEEVSNAVKAEIEKKKEEPKQVIWDGHSGSIGRTANQAMSQTVEDEQADGNNSENRTLPGPAPPPKVSAPPIRPLPPPPGLQLNIPRPPTSVQYSTTAVSGSMRPAIVPPPPMRPPQPPVGMPQMPQMVNRAPPPPSQVSMPPPMVNPPAPPPQVSMPNSMITPPPPGSQFTPITPPPPRPFGPPPPVPPPSMPMMPPPPPPQGIPPPPPPEEAPPPLPEEPEPKKPKIDDIQFIPEDQFLAQHPGSVRISVAVPNHEEGNLNGQTLELTIQSLSETISNLKEKIAAELALPANKQKLIGRAGFLKDNLSLAYYNIGPGETLTLTLRERGGKKR